MALDLWFREDISRILASTHETMRASVGALPALDPELSETYRQGFLDALRAIAIAFGVVVPSEPGFVLPARSVHFVEAEIGRSSTPGGDCTRRNGGRYGS
jgi:hypothetical protein